MSYCSLHDANATIGNTVLVKNMVNTCISLQIMTDVSTEIFQTFSISMGMQQIEDEIRDLRDQVISKTFFAFL